MEQIKSKTHFGEYSLKHWINLMTKRNIILPSYQRSFVWGVQDIERLILSFRTGQFIQPVTIARINSVDNGVNIILDGQQRLTSILLFLIGCFPKKDKFKELTRTSSEDDSAIDDSGDSVESEILDWTFEKLLSKDNIQNSISEIKHRALTSEYYEKLCLKKELCVMNNSDIEKFLDNTFLGFSYIVSESSNASSEQKFFSTLFRNMNYLGKKLSVLESRKSLYYLNDKFKNYFEGKLDDGSDALAGLKIMDSVSPSNIDFVRYLSILSQYHVTNEKKVMVGYSAYASRESFYVDYVSYILNLEQESRTDKFDKFNFKTTLGNDEWKERFKKLSQAITGLKDKMNLDKKYPDAFKSWIDADYWLFGLIYWIVFKGKEINLERDWSMEITSKIEKAKSSSDSYQRSPNLLSHLRNRLYDSVSLIKNHLVK